jgi:hypothetical protein
MRLPVAPTRPRINWSATKRITLVNERLESVESLEGCDYRAIKNRHVSRMAGLFVRCGLQSALEFLNLCLLLNDLGVEVLPCRSNLIFHGWRWSMSSSVSCAISGSGKRGCTCIPAPTRLAKRPSIRGSTTPSPTTTPNRSWRPPPPETSGSARVRLSHPLFSGPALRRPVFDFQAHFCHSAPIETHAFGFRLPASAPGAKSDFLSVTGQTIVVGGGLSL